jgi:hypothetical protein
MFLQKTLSHGLIDGREELLCYQFKALCWLRLWDSFKLLILVKHEVDLVHKLL